MDALGRLGAHLMAAARRVVHLQGQRIRARLVTRRTLPLDRPSAPKEVKAPIRTTAGLPQIGPRIPWATLGPIAERNARQ